VVEEEEILEQLREVGTVEVVVERVEQVLVGEELQHLQAVELQLPVKEVRERVVLEE
jgi:hypothetical protein